MWEHRIHARICIEAAGTQLPTYHRIISWLRDRGVDGPLVNFWRAVAYANNALPVAATGIKPAFVCLHAKRLGVFSFFVCVLIGTTPIRTTASADELQPSTLKSCYEAVSDSISACTIAISSGTLNGADLAKAYLSRGLAQQRLKQDENAINDLNEALKINPDDPQTINARGTSYLTLGQYDRAIQDYKRVIEINPKFVPAFFNIGLAFSAVRDFGHALDA
jgi:tetratricopeptide (TPR) repeat protein